MLRVMENVKKWH